MPKFIKETNFKKSPIGPIPKDWKVKKLGEVGKIVTGKTPPTKVREYWDGNIPFITPSEIPDFDIRYSYKVKRYVSEQWLNKARNYLLPPDTTCFVCIGSTGKICLTKENSFTNQQINSIIPSHDYDPLFVFYNLRANQFKIRDEFGGGGSVQSIINKSTFRSIPLPFPPLSEQERIATVLSWFDDLIENKRRQNEILEQTAMTIFKHWFIDFEPFKNQPFVFNETLQKEIPKNWKVKKASVIIDFNPPIRLINGKEYPFVEMKYIPINIMTCDYTYKKYNKSGTKFRGGDTLMARITPSLENGKTALAWFLKEDEYGFGSTEFFVLHPKKNIYREFVYLLARLDEFREVAINSMSGTSGRQRADINVLKTFPLPLPPEPILKEFHSLVSPLFEKIINNQKEIVILRQVRDTLLPKLVFGKIRIAEL